MDENATIPPPTTRVVPGDASDPTRSGPPTGASAPEPGPILPGHEPSPILPDPAPADPDPIVPSPPGPDPAPVVPPEEPTPMDPRPDPGPVVPRPGQSRA